MTLIDGTWGNLDQTNGRQVEPSTNLELRKDPGWATSDIPSIERNTSPSPTQEINPSPPPPTQEINPSPPPKKQTQAPTQEEIKPSPLPPPNTIHPPHHHLEHPKLRYPSCERSYVFIHGVLKRLLHLVPAPTVARSTITCLQIPHTEMRLKFQLSRIWTNYTKYFKMRSQCGGGGQCSEGGHTLPPLDYIAPPPHHHIAILFWHILYNSFKFLTPETSDAYLWGIWRQVMVDLATVGADTRCNSRFRTPWMNTYDWWDPGIHSSYRSGSMYSQLGRCIRVFTKPGIYLRMCDELGKMSWQMEL